MLWPTVARIPRPRLPASGEQGELPLLDHFRELRSRFLKALVALGCGGVVGYAVFPRLLDVAIAPYCSALASLGNVGSCTLVALRPLEPFAVRIQSALVVGLIVGGPVIFYQLWRFITPGLTSHERRYALPFVVLSQHMFVFGASMAYQIIPTGLRILLTLGGDQISAMLSASEYLKFFLQMSIAFGLVFELPLVLIFLGLAGVVTSEGLRKARPYAVVLMFIAGAFITPTTDAVTLLLVVGPMLVFYELSLLLTRLFERRRVRSSSV